MNILLWHILTLASFGISAAVGAACLRRRRVGGAFAYAFVAFSQAGWTLGFILEHASRSVASKLFWHSVQILCAGGWWLAFIAFAREFVRRRVPRPARAYALLSLPAAVFAILAFTDPLHGLLRADVRLEGEGPPGLIYAFEPAFLAGVAILAAGLGYGLLLIGARMAKVFPAQRRQVALVFVGNALPLLGTLLTVTALRASPYRDLSPFTFALGNLLVAVGLFRYGLFNVVPIARERIIEEMEDCIIVVDAEKRVIHLNRSAAAHARPGAKVLGRPVTSLFPGLDRGWGAPGEAERAYEIEEPAPDGPRWFEARIRPLRDVDGALLGNVAMIRDISARKRMELELAGHRTRLEELVAERTAELSAAYERLAQQVSLSEKAEDNLRQAQKMEAVGRLAGGIVHDFNNLLVPILGYAELARMEAKPGTRLHVELGQIEESARRASDLVAQILSFSRRQVLEFRILDLNDEIRKFAKMLGRFLGGGVRLELRLSPSLHAVRADRTQVQQILLNLCVNARDAMPDGGRLIIHTANGPLEDDSGGGPPAGGPGAPGVLLSVRDTGAGMDAETLKHVFEPFYTTKQDGKGTGLGLTVVYGIVERHGGRIRVTSRPGFGTDFRLHFPAASAPPASGESLAPEGRIFLAGMESVLVVDSDEGVRRLARDALAAHGYRVSQAAGAGEACEVASGLKGPIDLLLTDVELPDMGGPELFPKLKSLHPGLRVLYMSGFAERLAQEERHGAGVLKKPFAIRNLLEAVRLALGRLVPAGT